MTDVPSDLIDLETASRETGIKTATIRTWTRVGKVRAWKRGYYNMVSRAELAAFVEERFTVRPTLRPPADQDGNEETSVGK